MDVKLTDIDKRLDEMDNESLNDFKRYYGNLVCYFRSQKLLLSFEAVFHRLFCEGQS
jgi:hypothetical protein